MLPGFSPASYSLQDHFHLGVVPFNGDAPTGFGAHGEPPYQFTANHRVPKYEAMVTMVRSWSGKGRIHSLRTSDLTKPVVFTDIEYTLLVNPQQYDILSQMQKQEVYLVDHYHCANTVDHTPFVKHMWFADFSFSDHLDPLLNRSRVVIFLKDMNSV